MPFKANYYINLLLHWYAWNKSAKEIRKEYESIVIYETYGRVGETIAYYFMALTELIYPNRLMILSSMQYRAENKTVLKIINREIPFIMDENYAYWLYVCKKNVKLIDKTDSFRIVDRVREPSLKGCTVSSAFAHEHFYLSHGEISEAERKITYVDYKKPYICILNRDTAYGQANGIHHKYRNNSISGFKKMSEEFEKLGIPLIRMGQAAEHKVNFNNCIDFCYDYYDELSDVFLCGNCKFWIGAECGANLLARAQNTPCVTVDNFDFYVGDWPYIPIRKDDLFILKKYYSVNENRFLTLLECAVIFNTINYKTDFWDKLGIKIINNTEEEICDVAMEMNERIDGTWIETDEDRCLQKKFWDILGGFEKRTGLSKHGAAKGRIGAKFLRENQYLLEKPKLWF